MLDVICAGQAVIDCIINGKEDEPYRENVYRARRITLNAGGDAVNEAKHLSAMGYRTAIVCGLGKDLAGGLIEDLVSKEGVSTERIRKMDYDTPIANIMVREDGSRFSINSEATQLPGYRILPDELKGAKVVSFASLFRAPFADMGNTAELIRAAKAYGSIICCDTKLPLSDAIDIKHLSDALPLIDYIFPNEKEAAYYTGKKTFPEMADSLRSLGIKNVIIKTGPEGCYVSGQDWKGAIPAIKVDRVVNTTGAGDSFVAGFIAGILQKLSIRECAELGLTNAAQTITK